MPAIKRKGFLRFITEGKGGASAGKLELIKTNFVKAKQYVEKMYPDFDMEKEIPTFNKNYED